MVKLRIDRDDEIQEGEVVGAEWDIKKILGGLLVLVLLAIMASYLLLPKNRRDVASDTLGAATSVAPTPPLPDRQDVQKIIESAKESLAQITADNLTSSQAAVQKIISDLQELQGKSGAIGVVCSFLCKDE